MKASDTARAAYEGVAKILRENGQALSKAQTYAVESLVRTVEDAAERRCCELTEEILAKKDRSLEKALEARTKAIEARARSLEARSLGARDESIDRLNEAVEQRVQELKREIPQAVDYARMRKMEACMEQIRECVGYSTDEQVGRVAAESARMLKSTKALVESQARAVAEKAKAAKEAIDQASRSAKVAEGLRSEVAQRDARLAEAEKKVRMLEQGMQLLQRKVDESRRVNESLEQRQKADAVKLYLEQRMQSLPKFEAAQLRAKFQNARSRAEIDENFDRALAAVQGQRARAAQMPTAVPVAKAAPVQQKTISGGGTIVRESRAEQPIPPAPAEAADDGFVDVDVDDDTISNEQMQRWMAGL